MTKLPSNKEAINLLRVENHGSTRHDQPNCYRQRHAILQSVIELTTLQTNRLYQLPQFGPGGMFSAIEIKL
jgi:hypothetical protein